MCGEKLGTIPLHCFIIGSPPRVRGKASCSSLMIWYSRITPACAGKSGDQRLLDALDGDHPRVCGEKLALLGLPLRYLGSPPRVRGKAVSPPKSATSARITPACAGKRAPVYMAMHASRDHPRVCGEKRKTGAGTVATLGSPPRVRGKDRAAASSVLDIGITPACAGKSCHYR